MYSYYVNFVDNLYYYSCIAPFSDSSSEDEADSVEKRNKVGQNNYNIDNAMWRCYA
jgi:hypothetical protein